MKLRAGAVIFCLGAWCAHAQLNSNCTVSILNRNVQVNPDGTYVLPNVPANFGPSRARATCVNNGQTTYGQSALFTLGANQVVNALAIQFGSLTPIPVSLALSIPQSTLTAAGATAQIATTATYGDGTTQDVSPASAGTIYSTTNAAIATVSGDGLIMAVSSGAALIQATNEGASGILSVQVSLGGATVGGVDVSWAIAHGLNPNDPTMPMQDPDRDGLTNLQEFQLGTDPNNPDTDGDGLSDGDEVNVYKTQPLLADTDGDGIPDGVEIRTGTNPLDPASYDLTKAVALFTVSPQSFALTQSTINPSLASLQLQVRGLLIDGKTTVNLTSTSRRTEYTPANPAVCTMGIPDGTVYPTASSGACAVTVTNSNGFFSATVTGTVSAFSPTPLGSIAIPGAVAVDVAGNYAYVGTGAAGLTVVDVTDRSNPAIVSSLGGLGNVVAVRVMGNYVLAGDAGGTLSVVDITNPPAPSLLTTIPIPGSPNAIAAHGTVAAVAAQAGGVVMVSLANASAPAIAATVPTPQPALGVDFDPQTNIGVAAMGSAGIQVFDLSSPSQPVLRGQLGGGNIVRVLMRTPAVLAADTANGVTSISVANPDAPFVSLIISPGFSGSPQDIAAVGNIAITADHSFGRAVPIIGIGNSLLPSTLTYWTIDPPGFGTSIAMDAAYAYSTIGFGVAGGALRILQYQQIYDGGGIPPTASVAAPAAGQVLIQGERIQFSVKATDDIAVASVNFVVNGQTVSTATTPPYIIQYVVPSNVSTLDFSAAAVDYGGNVGVAPDVFLPVVPDPLTTAAGTVVDTAGAPVAGATVSGYGQSAITAANGTFALPGLPTIQGNLILTVVGVDNGAAVGGVSTPTPPVPAGMAQVGQIVVYPGPVIIGLSRTEGLANSVVSGVTATGINLLNATFAVSPANSGVTIAGSVSADGTRAPLTLTIGGGVSGTFAVVATTPGGSSSSVPTSANSFRIFNLNPNDDTDFDGLTNAQEIQIGTDPTNADTDGDGYIDGLEVLFGSNPLDPKSIPVVQTGNGYNFVSFSMLNSVNPGQDQATPETPTVTFSMLNSVNSGQDQATPQTPTVTFSMLNSVNPGQDQATPETPTVTFSMLNSVNPGQDQATPETPTVTFSMLNSVNPGVNQPSFFDPWVIFSALNTQQQASANILSPNFTFPSASGEQLHWQGQVSLAALRTLGSTVEARRRLMASFTGPDSDGDGLPDALEVMFGSDPHNADSDGDGLPDGVEYLLKGDPFSARPDDDDDGDGLTNIEEVRLGTDPSKADTDGDGLTDGEEVLRYHTDPLRMDTDGDGFPDGLEVALGTDPLDPRSFPTPLQLMPPPIFSKPLTIFNEKQTAASEAPRKIKTEQGVTYARKK